MCVRALARLYCHGQFSLVRTSQIKRIQEKKKLRFERQITRLFLLPLSPGVCWGASVHALLCHQAADGEGTH